MAIGVIEGKPQVYPNVTKGTQVIFTGCMDNQKSPKTDVRF